MQYLNRASARRQLETAAAIRAANAGKDDYVDWRNEMKENI